jgi:hypothetical protein
VPRWLLWCGFSIIFIVVAVVLLHYDSSIVKLVKFNRSDLLILSCEMLTETGPRFQDSAKRHAELLRQYRANIKQRYLADKLSSFPLYSKYSPENGIDKALSTLESVRSNDIRENAIAIWTAGEQLMQFRADTACLYRRVGLYKPARIPDALLQEIEAADVNSSKALESFKDNKTLPMAWAVCECNRHATLLVFSARSEYNCQGDNADRFRMAEEQLRKITAEANEIKKDWAKTLDPNSTEKKLVEMFARSEDRRCKIVEAMQKNRMDKANQLMWEAINGAIQNREREKVLEMALELEGKTQEWDKSKL